MAPLARQSAWRSPQPHQGPSPCMRHQNLQGLEGGTLYTRLWCVVSWGKLLLDLDQKTSMTLERSCIQLLNMGQIWAFEITRKGGKCMVPLTTKCCFNLEFIVSKRHPKLNQVLNLVTRLPGQCGTRTLQVPWMDWYIMYSGTWHTDWRSWG